MTTNNPEDLKDEEIERIIELQVPTLREKAHVKAQKCWELTCPEQEYTPQFYEMAESFFRELKASLFAEEWRKGHSKKS